MTAPGYSIKAAVQMYMELEGRPWVEKLLSWILPKP